MSDQERILRKKKTHEKEIRLFQLRIESYERELNELSNKINTRRRQELKNHITLSKARLKTIDQELAKQNIILNQIAEDHINMTLSHTPVTSASNETEKTHVHQVVTTALDTLSTQPDLIGAESLPTTVQSSSQSTKETSVTVLPVVTSNIVTEQTNPTLAEKLKNKRFTVNFEVFPENQTENIFRNEQYFPLYTPDGSRLRTGNIRPSNLDLEIRKGHIIIDETPKKPVVEKNIENIFSKRVAFNTNQIRCSR